MFSSHVHVYEHLDVIPSNYIHDYNQIVFPTLIHLSLRDGNTFIP